MSESDEITDLSRRLGELISGRYELKELVGQGGMAYVFRARDVRHDRFVAIKVLHPDLASAIGAERFLREVQTTASFAHPHILTLIDSGASDDILYYVMPFVEGESLRQKLSRETQLGLDNAMTIARDVASALSYAHERGVVHRDIKPANVLLLDGRASVTDFGIALAAGRPLSPAVWAPTKPQVAVIATTGTGASLHVVNISTLEQREIAQDVQPGRLLWTSSGEELTFIRRGVGPVTVRVSDGEEIAGPPLGNIAREFGSGRAPGDSSADTTGVLPSANRPNVLPDSRGLVVGQPIPPLVRAPDGDGFVAYSRGFAGLNGLVVVSADGSRRRITDTVAYPLVWNNEGTIFYVDDGVDGTGATHVHAISDSGGPARPWLDLPFSCSFANLTLSQNGERAVCAFSDAVSDVWLIDGIPGMSVR